MDESRSCEWQAQTHCLHLLGDWTVSLVPSLVEQFDTIVPQVKQDLTVDCQGLTYLDTSACIALAHFIEKIRALNVSIHLQHLQHNQQQLLERVTAKLKTAHFAEPNEHSWLYRLGEAATSKSQSAYLFLCFIGEIFHRMYTLCRHPRQLRLAACAKVVEQSGLHALPLLAFLSFLIGVVLTYQIGLQLRLYGANIFVVDLLSLSVLREFGPLITAILVAGRSGSAFTAQIGMMKVRQEIDALRVIGCSPLDILVIPRVLALMCILPLLSVWASCFALLGGMMMAQSLLDLSMTEFLLRARTAISLQTYWIGLIKTPVFGLVIASVGCFQGCRVSGSAASVGERTTKSVVQALFLIIIIDAIFSVIFSLSGL